MTTGCEDIAYCLVGYFILSHPVETAAMMTAKARQLLQRNSVSWQTSCRQQHRLEHCPYGHNQETVHIWTVTYLTWPRQTWNGIEFWSKRMAIYKLIGPLALDLLSVPASQAFVNRIFSLCGLTTAGRRNRMEKSLQMRAFLKPNKRLFEWQ